MASNTPRPVAPCSRDLRGIQNSECQTSWRSSCGAGANVFRRSNRNTFEGKPRGPFWWRHVVVSVAYSKQMIQLLASTFRRFAGRSSSESWTIQTGNPGQHLAIKTLAIRTYRHVVLADTLYMKQSVAAKSLVDAVFGREHFGTSAALRVVHGSFSFELLADGWSASPCKGKFAS